MASQRALLARIALALRPLGLIGLLAAPGVSVAVPALDEAAAGRFANLALHCAHMEYPNKISHTLGSDADVRPPRELAPAFFGCYDWHSSVHGHWLLARLARQFPQAPFAADARAALAQSLTPARIAGEVAYFQAPGRASFERPYGLAWLLLLAAELRAWDDPQAQAVVASTRAARSRGRATPAHLAAQAALSDPRRRAQPDRFRVRAGA